MANMAIGANKSVNERTGTLLLEQCCPLNGFTIVQLPQVSATTKTGITLNQTQYDTLVNFIDTKNPVKVLKVGGHTEDSPYDEDDYVIFGKVLFC